MKIGTWSLICTGAFVLSGCSISASIGASLSGSAAFISSPFESSASSSGGRDEKDNDENTQEEAYLRDIRAVTTAQLRRSNDLGTFRKEVARVAKKHGVSDWEARRTTWFGIGEGIAAIGVPSAQAYRTIALLGETHPDRVKTMQRGYDRALVATENAAQG